jgi:hypothetical protein
MLKHPVILTLFCPLATTWTMAGQSAPANAPESRVTAQNIGKAGSQQANPKQGNPNSPQPATTNVKPPSPTKQQETNAEQETLDIQRKLEWFTGWLMVASLMQAGTMLGQAGLMRGTLKQNRTRGVLMKGQLDQLCFKQFFEFVCTPVSRDDVLRYGHWSQWGEYSDNSQDSE